VALSASGPITFAATTTSSGTLTATSTETATETTTPLPSPDDDITVNNTVTVESTGGDVVFVSGDGITLEAGSTVKSDTGAVDLTVGQGDNDNDASLELSGTIDTVTNFSVTSPGDICVGNINAPGQTVTITSTGGAILDCADAPDGTDITAATVVLNAATGIGVPNAAEGIPASDAALEIQAGTLSFSNSTSGDVQVINVSGDLSASGSNSAAGGKVNLTVENGNALTVNSDNITSNNGDITLTADAMTLTGTVNAGSGAVTLAPFTAGRGIDLGTNPSAGKLGLAQGDLNNVTAGVLRIGSTAAGDISLTAALTDVGTSWNTLSLLSGGVISEIASGALTVANLAVQAFGGAQLTANVSAIGNLAAGSTSGGFSLLDSLAPTVTTVDGVSGINTAGDVLLESSVANNALTVSQGVTTSGGNIQFVFDNMTLGAAVSATGHRVSLEPFSNGQLIDLGGADAVGTLGLDTTDLGNVTAATLQVGNSTSGNLNVSAAVNLATQVGTLDLETGGGITQGAGATLTIPNLALRAVNAVTLNQANDVTTGALAADVTGAGQSFSFTDANDLTVGTADGLSGITTNGGVISVDTTGNLTVDQNVSAGAATIDLVAGGSGNLFSNNAAISNSGGNQITIEADRLALGTPLTSSITAAGGGRVLLRQFTGGVPIDLGSTSDPAGAFNLSNAELNTVATTGVLQIGIGGLEDVTVSDAINLTDIGTLTIDVSGSISNAAPADGITVANLRLSAGNAVSLTGANGVGTLAGAVTGAGQEFTFQNAGALDLNTVDTVSGITTNGGAVTVATADGNLTVDQNITAGAAAVDLTVGCTAAHPDNLLTNNAAITGDSATLTADRMALDAGTINVGTGATNVVTLQPCTPGRTIDLGGTGDPTGTLQLSNAELNTITSGLVRIGNNSAGNITLTAAIAPTGFNTLSLLTGGAISQDSGATLAVTNLALQGAGGVNLGEANQVSQIAGTTTNAAFTFTDAGPVSAGSVTLTVGTVDGLSNIDAGMGDVTLTVGTGAATGKLVSLNPNDNVADVTGNTVTLTTLGPTDGATGQIGFFTSSAQFFEVKATTINASTDNSRLWISALGGAAIGSVNAGTDFAILKTDTGDLTSTHTGSTPDITAGTVILIGGGGSFGNAANPLLTQTGNLRASTTGTGSINITNVAAGGNLNVASASTANGDINLTAAGGNLTTTAASGTAINAPGNTVTLNASGAIVSGTGAGVTDVAAANLAATGATGVGTAANPLKTVLSSSGTFGGSFAASGGTGGVFLSNTSAAMNVGSVGGLSGVTATGGAVTLTTSGDITVLDGVSTASSGPGAGAVTVSGNGTINILAPLTGASATVLGGSSADVITVETTGPTPLTVNGQGGGDIYELDFGNLASPINLVATGGGTNSATVNSTAASAALVVTPTQVTWNGSETITYSGIQQLVVDGGNAGNTFTIQGTAASTPVQLNTGNGNDAITVSSATRTLDQLKGPLSIDAGGGVNSLLVDEGGTSTPDTVAVNDTTIVSSGVGFTINYQATGGSFSNVKLQTGTGNDTVNVTPSASVPFILDGGAPTTSPGDTLNFDAGDLAVRTNPGQYTANGRQAVQFGNFETIHLNNADAVITSYGPDTADRGTALAGLDAQHRFVQVLYLNALGRVGSAAELNAWVNFLNSPGGSTLAVATDIEGSAEARDHLVKTWYRTFLGRSAVGGEELGFVNALLQGQSEEQVLGILLGSPEFYQHAQTLVSSGTTDQRFVEALYLLLLNRTASGAEVGAWTSALPGLGRNGAAVAFESSPEFRTDLVEADYNVFLHRPADPASLSGWVNSSLDDFHLRLAFESSPEFFING
jgi:hypothetical protein